MLIILKRLLEKRPKLKLVLMSATLNAKVFADYFKKFDPHVASIPGRAHPVQAFFLEDALALTRLKVDARSECAYGGFKSKQASRNGFRSEFAGLTKRDWATRLPDYPDETHASLSALDAACVNYELIVKVVESIFAERRNGAWAKRCFSTVLDDRDGAVLVFVTGLAEITATVEGLQKSEKLRGIATIHALHSQLSTQDQQAVFKRPPRGTRKVVVSTNIAETSITIDDVVYVVDAARVKENRYDADRGLATLEEVFVSRAAARQRRGRAGRVRPGVAFHLVAKAAHDGEFDAYPQPEILRTSLEDLVLQILVLDLGDPKVFLRGAVSPPTAQAVDRALELLSNIDALEPMGDEGPRVAALTALGFHLAALPVEPRVGKLLLVGAMLGACGAALTLAAVMTSTRSIFVAPFDMRDQADEARRTLAVAYSDHLTGVAAFDEWRKQKKDRREFAWARAHFCGVQTLKAIDQAREQFAQHLQSIGFVRPGRAALREALAGAADLLPDAAAGRADAAASDRSARSAALLKALLCAGLYPNVLLAPKEVKLLGDAKREPPSDGPSTFFAPSSKTKTAGEVAFTRCDPDVDRCLREKKERTQDDRRRGGRDEKPDAPEDAAFLHPCCLDFGATALDHRCLVYREIVRTAKVYVRDATTVAPLALILFGGRLTVHHERAVISVDEKIHFRAPPKIATLAKILRGELEALLLRKIVAPHEDVSEREVAFVDASRPRRGSRRAFEMPPGSRGAVLNIPSNSSATFEAGSPRRSRAVLGAEALGDALRRKEGKGAAFVAKNQKRPAKKPPAAVRDPTPAEAADATDPTASTRDEAALRYVPAQVAAPPPPRTFPARGRGNKGSRGDGGRGGRGRGRGRSRLQH